MLTRRSFIISAIVLAATLIAPGLRAAELPKVVASFSILGDIVHEVGGNRIAITTLVGPDGDAHVYQPTPADARAVADARLVVVNGLGFEGWLDRLVSAAGYKGSIAVATEGLSAIKSEEDEDHDGDHAKADDDEDHEHHRHGEFDPHAWQSIANVRICVANIVKALTSMDPVGAKTYESNAARYLAELDALDNEIRSAIATLPRDRRKVVTSHDAFGYFAHEYGIEFLAPVGMSTESEASAGDVAKLIRQIKNDHIYAVFVENISDRRLLDQIAKETDANIGGTLYSDALSSSDGPANTYLKMMRHNYRTLTGALNIM